jgi:hypothetical protein
MMMLDPAKSTTETVQKTDTLDAGRTGIANGSPKLFNTPLPSPLYQLSRPDRGYDLFHKLSEDWRERRRRVLVRWKMQNHLAGTIWKEIGSFRGRIRVLLSRPSETLFVPLLVSSEIPPLDLRMFVPPPAVPAYNDYARNILGSLMWM